MFEVACFTVDRRVKKNKVSSKRSNTLIEKLMSGKKREGGRQAGREGYRAEEKDQAEEEAARSTQCLVYV